MITKCFILDENSPLNFAERTRTNWENTNSVQNSDMPDLIKDAFSFNDSFEEREPVSLNYSSRKTQLKEYGFIFLFTHKL